MLWWIPIAVAGMACLGVLTVVASTAAGRSAGRHVLTDPQEEWDAWSAEQQPYGSMALSEERWFREREVAHGEGSNAQFWPAPPVDPEPWRAQMTAELSPEALDALPEIVLPDAGGWISGPCLDEEVMPGVSPPDVAAGERHHVSPGPGVPPSSLTVAPGPVSLDGGPTVSGPEGAEGVSAPPVQPSRWLAEQLEILRAWSERQQAYAEILA